MAKEIINKIDKANLITLDVGSLAPNKKIQTIDLAEWLEEGGIIRESSFKDKLKKMEISDFNRAYVSVFCSKNAIIPPWAYLLIQVKLRNIAKEVFFCDKKTMKIILFERNLKAMDMSCYKDKRVFLKGCTNKEFPLLYSSLCVTALGSTVKSLFYGEPCSNVLLIKN